MQGRRVEAALAALVAVVASGAGPFVVAACGDDEVIRATPAPASADAQAADALPAPTSTGTPLPTVDAGTFEVVDVADTACAVIATTEREVLAPAGSELARPTALVALGDRRGALAGEAFVAFGADGAGPSVPFGGPEMTALAARDTGFGALRSTVEGVAFQGFTSSGTASGVPQLVVGATSGIGLGSFGQGWIAVAATPFSPVFAAYLDADGTTRATREVRAMAETVGFRALVAPIEAEKVAVVMSGTSIEGDVSRLAFARLGPTGLLAQSNTLLKDARLEARGFVHLPDGGFAVLFRRGGEALLSVLDAEGRFRGPSRRLEGVGVPSGLAIAGSRLAVVAVHRDAAGVDGGDPGASVAIRTFAVDGTPTGPWGCLEAPGPADANASAAVSADGTGFAVLRWTRDRSVVLSRVP